MASITNYLGLIRFSHTVFAMPFALIGFCTGLFSNGNLKVSAYPNPEEKWLHPIESFSNDSLLGRYYSGESLTKLIILYILFVVASMIFARSSAMAFNRYLDREFDARNPRTAVREIPRGIITPAYALAFTIVNAVLFIITTYFINRLCFFLSPVALMIILGYSYTKRFTAFCHLVLGLGLALAPIGAYIAVTGRFDLLPVLFSFAVLCWVSGFDIIYALQDVEFDRSQQLYSIPAAMGKKKALVISRLLHIASAAFVWFAGWYGNFNWAYFAGAGLFTGMLAYQHSIVKPDDLRRVNVAFMTANGIASVIFSVFVIADLLLLSS